MHFKDNQNGFFLLMFCLSSCVVLGMVLETKLNLPEYIVTVIGVGLYILFYLVDRLRIELNTLRRIKRKIRKLPYKHQQLKMFFNEYIPETRKTYPKTIYKYVSLDDISQEEKNIFNAFSTQIELENWILNLEKDQQKGNKGKLFSLVTNSLWFSRSNDPKLNDPFEGRRIVYDTDYLPLKEWQIEYWKQYAEAVRNNLFLCCFSKSNDSPPMWANYANNYKGFCLEFEVANTCNLWEVDYDYGKNLPNIEIDGLRKDLWEDRITREEAYEYLERLHIYWASSKHADWEHEDEIRALFTNLKDNMNIEYETIGIKLSAIIIGHNCIEEHRKFLTYIATKLSIPIKCTFINTTSINYLDIIDFKE